MGTAAATVISNSGDAQWTPAETLQGVRVVRVRERTALWQALCDARGSGQIRYPDYATTGPQRALQRPLAWHGLRKVERMPGAYAATTVWS